MRILLTIHEKFLPDSGSAGSTFRLGQEYEKLGHDVSFFSLDDMPQMQRQVKRFVFPEFVAAHIAKLSREQNLDVVDGAPGDNWIWGSASRSLGWVLGARRPVVVTRSHGLQHLEDQWYGEEVRAGRMELSWFYTLYRGGYLLWEIGNSFRCADLAFFLNQREADYARDVLGVEGDKIRVFPNGMPDAFMNLALRPLPTDLEKQTVRIAHIGTYIQRKGIDYSVPALTAALKKYPNVEVSFIGSGFSELDEPEQLVYKDFDPGLHHRIQVIPTYGHETLPDLLKDHHIMIFPSLSEGFGKALVEGMACGLTPITTDADGPMEIVRDEHDALVIAKRDAKAIESSIDRLMHHRELLGTLRGNAYETAQNYSWKRIAQDRLLHYEQAREKYKSVPKGH